MSSAAVVHPSVVIDTNVLIAPINRRNSEFFLYESFNAKAFDWVVSTEVLNEYLEPYYRWHLIDNYPDDSKFSDLALSSNAYCLVPYDKQFDLFKSLAFPSLTIMNPVEFKAFLTK